jgi:hypothetical protein
MVAFVSAAQGPAPGRPAGSPANAPTPSQPASRAPSASRKKKFAEPGVFRPPLKEGLQIILIGEQLKPGTRQMTRSNFGHAFHLKE